MQIAYIECIPATEQKFDEKKVHLAPGSGAQYVRRMLLDAKAASFLDDADDTMGDISLQLT